MHWIGFGLADALTRSTVHFLPAAQGSAVPYPAECRLTIFGEGHEGISVQLEGARIGQPDGVKLEDAFPAIRDAIKSGNASMFGLEVSLSTIQPKVDLTPSLSMVELTSKGSTIKYWPRNIHKSANETIASSSAIEGNNSAASIPLIKDAYLTPSILVVNSRSQTFNSAGINLVADEETIALGIPDIGPRSLIEFQLDPKLFYQAQAIECSWGLVRSRILILPKDLADGIAIFLVQRDSKTKRLMSVSCL